MRLQLKLLNLSLLPRGDTTIRVVHKQRGVSSLGKLANENTAHVEQMEMELVV
eukprot:SAG11_NODE_23351_length_390_cov_0.886598_1_plen_52_part_10